MREREGEHHCCYSNRIFLCVNIYNVTINLRKICVITFTENYRESCVRASKRCFHLVLLSRPFTHSLPARIASMVDTKQSSKTFLFLMLHEQNEQLLNDW